MLCFFVFTLFSGGVEKTVLPAGDLQEKEDACK